jgi:hypothetical protein
MYFTVTVDTEEEWDWQSGCPTGATQTTNVARLPKFQELCTKYGVAPTYFVNRAVLEDPRSQAVVQELAARPDVEIGMHVHPWNSPPIVTPDPIPERETFLANLPADVVRDKLAGVYERFAAIGLRPTSFRGGRYSSGGAVYDFLRERGFLVDASVLPFTDWPYDGAPDYRRRDLEPVRLPPRHSGERPLWEIPLTLAFTRKPFFLWSRLFRSIERSWLGTLHLIGIAERLGVVRKVWLNFEDPLGERMESFLPRLAKWAVPCICFTVHSSSLVAAKGPYTKTPADERRIFDHIERVFAALQAASVFLPTTMTNLARHLETQYHARSRN